MIMPMDDFITNTKILLFCCFFRILEKQNSMSDELGRDGATVSMLMRKHLNFIQDLQTLQVDR